LGQVARRRIARYDEGLSMAHDSPGRVLIVDDNVAHAENVAEILELQGYPTHIAASAEDALLALARDIVVLVADFRLPGIDGVELIRRVKSARQDVRCFLMSAYGDEQTVASAERAGARFFPKPVDLAGLVQCLRPEATT
jgi:DNA-binding NtrC family response regulator